MFEVENYFDNTVRIVPENQRDVEILQKNYPHLVVTDYGVMVKKHIPQPVDLIPWCGIKGEA